MNAPLGIVATAPLPNSRRRRERLMVRATIVLCMITGVLLVGIAFGPRYWKYWNYQPQEGDIIMQSLTRGPMINMIEGATKSPWSHCGIVMREQGRWVVYEASSYVEGTPLADVILRSRDEQYAIYRLKPEHRQHIPRVLEEVRKLDGLPYDTRYEMDDEKIYCSELIYKAYRNATGRPLGKLVRLDELAWQPYEQFIEKLEGGPVPLDRVMITPRDLAQAEQLELVYSGIAKP